MAPEPRQRLANLRGTALGHRREQRGQLRVLDVPGHLGDRHQFGPAHAEPERQVDERAEARFRLLGHRLQDDRVFVVGAEQFDQAGQGPFGREPAEERHGGVTDDRRRVGERADRRALEFRHVDHPGDGGERRGPDAGIGVAPDHLHERVPAAVSLEGAEAPDQSQPLGGLERPAQPLRQRRLHLLPRRGGQRLQLDMTRGAEPLGQQPESRVVPDPVGQQIAQRAVVGHLHQPAHHALLLVPPEGEQRRRAHLGGGPGPAGGQQGGFAARRAQEAGRQRGPFPHPVGGIAGQQFEERGPRLRAVQARQRVDGVGPNVVVRIGKAGDQQPDGLGSPQPPQGLRDGGTDGRIGIAPEHRQEGRAVGGTKLRHRAHDCQFALAIARFDQPVEQVGDARRVEPRDGGGDRAADLGIASRKVFEQHAGSRAIAHPAEGEHGLPLDGGGDVGEEAEKCGRGFPRIRVRHPAGGGGAHRGLGVGEEADEVGARPARLGESQRQGGRGTYRRVGVGRPRADPVRELRAPQLTHEMHRGGSHPLIGVVEMLERGGDALGEPERAERVERGGPEAGLRIVAGHEIELGAEVAPAGAADGLEHRDAHGCRGMRQAFGQQLAGPGIPEPGQGLDRLTRMLALLDVGDQARRDVQTLERHGGADPDLGVRVVERQQERPFGLGAHLLERLDAAHPDPPGRIAEGAHQALDDLGLVELPEGVRDPRPHERRGIAEQVVEQVAHGAPVPDPAEGGGALGAHLVVQVAQRAHQGREGPGGADLAEDAGGPGARRVARRIGQEGDHRVDGECAVPGEDVRDPGRQPHLGMLERLDQRAHRARITDARQGAERDLPDVGVLGARGGNGLEQCRHRLGVADPSQQLGGEGSLPPLRRRPEPGDVLLHQAEPVVGVEQPGGALGRAARLLLQHRLERLEVLEGREFAQLGFEQHAVALRQPRHEVAVEALAMGEAALEAVQVGGVQQPAEHREEPGAGHRRRDAENDREFDHARPVKLFDAAEQVREVDRLGDEVIGAHLAGPVVVGGLVLGRQDEDRAVRRGGIRLEGAADLVAVHAGHHHVEQDQVGPERVGGSHSRLPVRGGHDSIAGGGKDPLQEPSLLGTVVDDEKQLRHAVTVAPRRCGLMCYVGSPTAIPCPTRGRSSPPGGSTNCATGRCRVFRRGWYPRGRPASAVEQ